MAAGAGEGETQERLRVALGEVDGAAVDEEVVDRALLVASARRGRQLARERVPGLVGGHTLPDPVVESLCALAAELPARDEQDVGPLVRPVVDELRPLQQRVDEPFPLGGRGVGPEAIHVLGPGEDAGGVEESAPDELGVGAQAGGGEVELLQLGQHQVVDEVAPLRLRVDLRGHRERKGHGHPRRRHLAQIGHVDGRLAVALHLDEAGVADLGHRLVAGGVAGPPRHVLHGPVREARLHRELQLVAFGEHAARGRDLHAADARVRLGGGRHAGGDPGRDHPVLGRAHLEAAPAHVGDRTGGLEKDEAPRRLQRVGAPAGGLARQRHVVGLGVVTAQRQLEAVLARGGSVTGAGVASHLGHHGDDVVAEADVGGQRRQARRRRGSGVGTAGPCGGAQQQRAQGLPAQNSSLIGSTPWSTTRSGRFWGPGRSASRFTPMARSTVAATLEAEAGRSLG